MKVDRFTVWALLVTALMASQPAAAAPFLPRDDAVVLETLPGKPGDPAAAELRRLRAAVLAAPGDVAAAARLAGRYFDLAKQGGDARAALAAASENYRKQREPRDALVLIEAALAARDPTAAAPALQWLETSRFEGRRMRDAAAKLKALQP